MQSEDPPALRVAFKEEGENGDREIEQADLREWRDKMDSLKVKEVVAHPAYSLSTIRSHAGPASQEEKRVATKGKPKTRVLVGGKRPGNPLVRPREENKIPAS